MLRKAIRHSIVSVLLAGTVAGCGTVDKTLFSGDSAFSQLADAQRNIPTPGPQGSLAKVDDPRVFLNSAALISEQEQNYESAAGHWGRLYASEPTNMRYALNTAKNLRRIGRYEDAERILRQSLREKPANTDLNEELAKTLIASGRLREGAASLTALAAAPGIDPKRASRFHSTIGVAFDRAGKHREAQASYAKALQADPLNAIALSNRGLSYALSGDLDLAEKSLREALIAPNASIQVRQNLAMVLALKGDNAGARRLANQDLPPTMAKRVVSYYGGIGDQTDVWSDAAAQ